MKVIFQAGYAGKSPLLGLVFLGIALGYLVGKLSNPYYALLGLGAVFLILALFRQPQAGIAASIFTIWLEHGLVNYNPEITLTKIMVLLTGTSLVINLALQKLRWRPVKVTLPLAVLVLTMLVADFYSPVPHNGLLKLSTFASQVALIYLIVQGIRDLAWIRVILAGLVSISVYQAFQSFLVMQKINIHDTIVRLSGNYADPNVFARGLLTSLTLCVIFWVFYKKWFWRLVALAISVLLMSAIFFTGSRSSVVTSLAMIILMVLLFMGTQGFSWLRLGKQIIFVLVVVSLNLAAGYYLVDYVPQAYTQRILNMIDAGIAKTAANNDRAILYNVALQTISENPLLGVGLSGFRTYSLGLLAIYPHNIFLETWVEVGIAGFLAMVLLLGIPIWVGYRELMATREDPARYGLVMMVMAGYLVNLLYAQFIGQITSHKPLWIFLGLILALVQINKTGEQGDQSGQNLFDYYCSSGYRYKNF